MSRRYRQEHKGNQRHWQNKPFYLTHTYKYGLHKIISGMTRMSPKAKAAAHIVVDMFCDTPSMYRNLESMARELGVSAKTLRSYREQWEKFGIFRFDVPPYWRRRQTQFATATQIFFPTKKVEKWLRDNDFFTNIGKKDLCSQSEDQQLDERNVDATGASSRTSVNFEGRTSVKETEHTNEVVGAAAAMAVASRPLTGQAAMSDVGPPTRENGFGAIYAWYDDNDNKHEDWFEATTERPDDIPRWLGIGARIEWFKCCTGTVAGYGILPPDDDFNILILWDETRDGDDVIPQHLAWVDVFEEKDFKVINAVETASELETPARRGFNIGDRVRANKPNHFIGVATVVGFDEIDHPIVTPDVAPKVKMRMNPYILTLEIDCRVSDVVETDAYQLGGRVRHLTVGDGAIQTISGNSASVKFDDGTSRNVLFAFLQLIDTEVNLGFPTEKQDATGSVPGDASQGLVG